MKDLPERRGTLLDENEIFGEKRFREAALSSFQGLSAHVSGEDGIHLVMAALAAEARAALQQCDVDQAAEICRFVDLAIEHPNAISEIENAVEISFLDHSDLVESPAGLELKARMSAGLRRLLLQEGET